MPNSARSSTAAASAARPALGRRLGERDADRERPSRGSRGRAAADREVLPVDPRLEGALDGLEEVVAVRLRVKADEVRAQQAVEQLVLPRADPEGLGVGPGDVPEDRDARVRPRLA